MAPDALVVQDVTLIHQVDLFAGLSPEGYVLVNTTLRFDDLGFGEFFRRIPPRSAAHLPGHRARARTARPPSPERRTARRLRRAHQRDLPRCHRPGYSPAIRRQPPASATWPRPAPPSARQPRQRRGSPVRRQIEGSRAVAETVALCRPEVVCAYPISPQTHIIEAIGAMVKSGDLAPCEFINVESEFAAMSVSIGASATGARAYTATASQGLLFMIEAVYNAAGLGLPIVMTLANRAIGAPINIWNDHSDAMAVRDSGWIQLFAETNQEAADLHIQAFRLAEELSLPVMVCMDGFILTHAVEGIDCPNRPTSTPSSRPTSPARFSTRTTRSPSAPWWDPKPSRRCATSHTSANSTRWIASPPWHVEFSRHLRSGQRRAPPQLPDRGGGDDRRRPRVRPRHDQGRGR